MKYIIGILALLYTGIIPATAQPTVLHRPADKDILWHKDVWRRIDIYTPPNAIFRLHAADSLKDMLPVILMDMLHAGTLTVYADDSCTIPLSVREADSIARCHGEALPPIARQYLHYRQRHAADNTDTIPHRDHLTDTAAIADCTYPQQVVSYYIKEEWIFDSSRGQIIVHINAIAPEAMIQGHPQPLWWVRYDDITPALARHNIYTGDGKRKPSSWFDWFGDRRFSSLITRVSPEMGRKNTTQQETPQEEKKKKKKKRKHADDGWFYL